MNSCLKVSVSASTVLILTACAGGGGGGGGSGGGGVVVTPFTSWSAIQPNTTVQASGGSTTATYTANPSTGQVLSLSSPTTTSSGTTANFTYGPTTITGISFQAGSLTSSINTNAGDTIATSGMGAVLYGYNAARTTTLIAPSADWFGWDYQSFGIWITGQGAGSGGVGAASVGSATNVTGIPATGTGTFAGNSLGVYVNSSGSAFYTIAAMTANANFANRTVAFLTSGTYAVNLATGIDAPANGLNLTSNMTYSGGVISGSITSANGMSGTATGKFFGPSAQEIGGTYSLSGGGASLIGGFGGLR